jgi:flagellar hook-basal body complex protein FliE
MFDDIVPADPKAKAPSKETVKPVSSNDAGAIATTVGDIAVSLVGFRKNINKLTDTLKKVASSAEKAASGAASETEEDTKKVKLALQKAAANVVRASAYGPQQVGKYALETCKAGLDLCELSLKKYSTEK